MSDRQHKYEKHDDKLGLSDDTIMPDEVISSRERRLRAISWISGQLNEDFSQLQKVDAVARMAIDHNLADAIASVIQGVHDHRSHKLKIQAVLRILSSHVPISNQCHDDRSGLDIKRTCCC